MNKDNIKKQLNKPLSSFNLVVIFITMILHRCCTEVSTNCAPYLQTGIVNEFFNKGNYEEGLANYSLVLNVIGLSNVLVLLYKTLADKLGRRPIMIINALGMAVASLLSFYSPNVYVYFFAYVMIIIFGQTGLHMVYFVEIDENGNGRRLFAMSKAIGLIGTASLPLIRNLWLSDDISLWRNAFKLPLYICVITLVLSIFSIRETKPFLRNKLENTQKEKKNKIGLLASIDYIFQNKEVLIIVVAFILMYGCGSTVGGYLESLMAVSGFTSYQTTITLLSFSLTYAFTSYISGVITKKNDSHKTASILGIFSFIFFFFYIMSIKVIGSPVLVGIMYGLNMGSLWMSADFLKIYMVEKAPIDLRSSVVSGAEALMLIFTLLSNSINVFLMKRVGLLLSNSIVFVVCIGICNIILLKKYENK